MDKLRYWIGFNRTKGIGPVRLKKLVEFFGDIEVAWRAPATALKQAGLDQRTLTSLLTTRAACDLDAELRAVEQCGAFMVTIEDTAYPPLLRGIEDAPLLLYVKGTLTDADQWALAIVGTRRATPYGKAMAEQLAGTLAQHGITIISGLAYGIDAAAHQAAIDAGGRTIAVLPNGIDRIYPPEHLRLAEAITAHGALISELPIGTFADKRHFPPRNRLVSGLALGVVIVEAAEKSGALITADLALEQGREVFAVPGSVLSSTSKGTNLLIQSGAKMVTRVEDILDELAAQLQPQPKFPLTSRLPIAKAVPVKQTTAISSATPDSISELTRHDQPDTAIETHILQCLSTQPRHIDDLSHRLDLPVWQVSSALTLLELKGAIRQTGVLEYVINDTP